MATTLTYSAQPISTRVDPRGRYYARIDAPALTAEETLRDVMAYKKINAFSASTVLNLLNDLLQGAVELTALDGRTRTLGQMLRVYMALEGSYQTPILTAADKANLRVKTQLLKDMKYPVDDANFTLTPKGDAVPAITAVHYSGQPDTGDAIKFGADLIINGRNLTAFDWTTADMYLVQTGISSVSERQIVPVTADGFLPSYNALAAAPITNAFGGEGPWTGRVEVRSYNTDTEEYYVAMSRDVKVLPADTTPTP